MHLNPVIFRWAIIFCFTFFFGACSSIQESGLWQEQPVFSRSEILSKTWKTPNGSPVGFIGMSTNAFEKDMLVVAHYGDVEKSTTNYLDFYLLLPEEFGPQKGLFLLLAHDWGPLSTASKVTSVKSRPSSDGGVFSITRSYDEATLAGYTNVLYYYNYHKKHWYRMTLNNSQKWTP
jgi:hypothetical protein